MNIEDYYAKEGEKPLDRITEDGGFCGIFRTIGCIGDSLSSGEFEAYDQAGNINFLDCFEHSWGQYMARRIGSKVYNFSQGGMTAKAYLDGFAQSNDYWNPSKACEAYIMALGVNDLCNMHYEIGSVKDIDINDYENNKPTFAGDYAKIIQKYRQIQPNARFFLVTFAHCTFYPQIEEYIEAHSSLLKSIAEIFPYTYVIDLAEYAPVYDEAFRKNFYLGGHLNPAGYLLTAKIIMSYIDYIIRHNPEDFAQTGLIGSPYHK